jgi:hypothetical protein
MDLAEHSRAMRSGTANAGKTTAIIQNKASNSGRCDTRAEKSRKKRNKPPRLSSPSAVNT